jgi:SecD/SecF fusion protein
VGPSLGQEAINNGFMSFMIALGLILLFMGFYYSNSGWVADIALFVNIFFIMGVLTSIGAVLTLPGIAGIVLTVGMSVDANVLIYERIREELRHGKGIRLAIADGFKMAYSSIIDSNVTTIIVGVVLFINGTGPVQGFATTLIIGILTSLFTAIFISRLVFEFMLGRNMNIKFSTKLTANAFKNVKFNWIGNRRKYYILSGLVTLAGIVSLATRGLNYGIDFTGGRSYVVRFESPVETSVISQGLATPFGGNSPEVKTFGDDNQVKITTKYRIDDKSENVSNEVEKLLNDGLAKVYPANKASVQSSDMVGPTVADDIKRSSVWSFLFAVAGIFLYIVFRFRKWEFGLGAVISLLHDAFMLVSVFSIFYGILPFSLEIDQAFIAAILTVMGYSINDTVVVFDRIREYLNDNKKAPDMKVVINDALNATISRTILTSLTIFLVLFAIFVFGGEVIRGFSFALLVGVVVGTYSSLCIATPLAVDFGSKRNKAAEDANKKAMAK